MSKMVPSPDWFVGLDSLNLCENGRFVDSITVEVSKLLVKIHEKNLVKNLQLTENCDLTILFL